MTKNVFSLLVSLCLRFFGVFRFLPPYLWRFFSSKDRSPIPYHRVESDDRLVETRFDGFDPRAYAKHMFLVTGGSGVVGARIVSHLIQHGARHIRVFDLVPPKITPEEGEIVEFVKGNLTNREQVHRVLEGIDVCFHVASLVDPYGSRDHLMYSVNVEGTRNVLEAARSNSVKSFIYTSSTAVLESGSGFEKDDEFDHYPVEKLDEYAATKRAAERLVLEENGVGGMLTIALRFQFLHGPETLLSSAIIRHAKEFVIFRFPQLPQSPAYVDNVAHAHMCAYEHLVPGATCAGRAYCVGDEDPSIQDMSYHEFVDWTRSLANIEPCRTLPVWVSSVLVLIFTVGSYMTKILNRLSFGLIPVKFPLLNDAQLRYAYDNHRLRYDSAHRDIGYEAIISKDQMIRELKYYFSNTFPSA